ncbi:hypothetical protein DXG03_007469 [Asterophora parasitica]|uniref:Uncharacterized protein n=1 Tax=Asterophora parasitica TaxID=117018 RepID=A0A9P7FY56_9AGAR|nr:hypothetical protein DXG03_007469 [Asterophora parasitica]
MDRTAQDFTRSFYTLPPGGLDALLNSVIKALSLQERYSLVQACNFLVYLCLWCLNELINITSPQCTLINRSSVDEALAAEKQQMLQTYGRQIMKAVLEGFASVAPRRFVPVSKLNYYLADVLDRIASFRT